MELSVQFLFAEPAKTQLMGIWKRLSTLPGGRALVDSPYEPHITVGLFKDIHLESLVDGLTAVVSEPFALSLATLASFPTAEGTLFLTPIPNAALLQLHERICALVLKLGGALRQPEFYAPGNWVPHCSVAWRAPQSTILEAVRLLLNDGFPQHAVVDRLGIFNTPDDALLQIVPLSQ